MPGLQSNITGRAAEDAVARHYEALGYHQIARRWRMRGAEIDLIMGRDADIVFVEVKAARDLATAAGRLTMRQLGRVWHAAEVFLANAPLGLLTPARIDAALVDGLGRIELIENAYMA